MENEILKQNDAFFMKEALKEAVKALDKDEVPIGAVVVCNGKIIARAHNLTEMLNDPTAHAEITAIRNACKKLGNFKLDGCTVYSSCEPCPMCLSALYWAGVERICYGNTKQDAKEIEFDDSFIYDQLELPYSERSIKCEHFMRDKALVVFRKWQEKEDKIKY